MRLPAVPVTSFQDATLNAEALQAVLTTRTGTVTFTFTASAVSASQTVTHGVDHTPLVFLQSTVNFVAAVVSAATATTFTANAFDTTNVAFTGSVTCYWLAIG